MQTNPFQSQKLRDKKKKQQKIKRFVLIFCFIAVIVFIVYITNASYFRVQRIVVNDLQYANRNDVELTIKEQIDSRYMGLFAKSNIFILPRTKIYREIRNNYPAVKKSDIDLSGLTEITVELEEYSANAIWCDVPVTPSKVTLSEEEEGKETSPNAIPQVVASVGGSNCYFVNDEGIVFSKTNYDQNPDIIKMFGNITVDPMKQSYTEKNIFIGLVEFTKLLRRLDIVADQVWTTNGEVYAFVTKDRVKIYVDGSADMLKVFDNLETVIERDAINKAQFGNIDYIDLRFGNRVFYKLK